MGFRIPENAEPRPACRVMPPPSSTPGHVPLKAVLAGCRKPVGHRDEVHRVVWDHPHGVRFYEWGRLVPVVPVSAPAVRRTRVQRLVHAVRDRVGR